MQSFISAALITTKSYKYRFLPLNTFLLLPLEMQTKELRKKNKATGVMGWPAEAFCTYARIIIKFHINLKSTSTVTNTFVIATC